MMATIANKEMAAAWDGDEGAEWARDWERYDRAVAGYQARLMAAAAIGPAQRVLDVGCGNGETSRAAARQAAAGSVLGVDLSSSMLERARQLAATEGLANVRFEQADAQVQRFEPGAFDVVVSRFGTMFFADPVAALPTSPAPSVPAVASPWWRGRGRTRTSGCGRSVERWPPAVRSLSRRPAHPAPSPRPIPTMSAPC